MKLFTVSGISEKTKALHFFSYCTSKKALLNIVVSLTCTVDFSWHPCQAQKVKLNFSTLQNKIQSWDDRSITTELPSLS